MEICVAGLLAGDKDLCSEIVSGYRHRERQRAKRMMMETISDGDGAAERLSAAIGIEIVSVNIGNRIVSDCCCGPTSVVRSSI